MTEGFSWGSYIHDTPKATSKASAKQKMELLIDFK